MKKLIIILLILPLFAYSQMNDKYMHVMVSAFATYGTIAVVEGIFPDFPQSKLVGFMVGIAVGLAKEIWMDNMISGGDIIANYIGCTIGIGLSYAHDNYKKKHY